MSNSRASGNPSNGSGAAQSIPPGSRKMVQSLKEIVNYPEAEIYATLKECNMDPNEAVNRLLSQDPFHEVKSKREKRKESKDTTESRFRGTNSTSNRGGWTGGDRYLGRGGSESGVSHSKLAYKKENSSNSYTGSVSSLHGVPGNNINRRASPLSEDAAIESKKLATGTVDIVPSPQSSSGDQSGWVGVPGQLSMADIVKMGRSHNKGSNAQNASYQNTTHYHTDIPPSHENLQSSEDTTFKMSEVDPGQGVSSSYDVSTEDEWPSIEHPPAASVHLSEPPPDSKLQLDPPMSTFDRIDQQSPTDEVESAEDSELESNGTVHVGSASVSSRKLQEDISGGSSVYDQNLYRNMGSYQPNSQVFEHQEDGDADVSVTSVTANLQQLNVQEKDMGISAEGDVPSVVIPDHLQVQNADCSHLSFGSFNSSVGAALSGSSAPVPMKSSLDEAPKAADVPSVGHSGSRNDEYYGDESIRNDASDHHLFHRTSVDAGSYDTPTASQPEVSRSENAEVVHGNQFTFPSSNPGYSFESVQQLNVPFSQAPMSSQIQNLAPFSSVTQGYTNSLPSSLLAANIQPGRESDPPYAPFPSTQSMPTKYGNAIPSVGGSTISMQEALKTVGQLTPQNLSGASGTTGTALPQHLAMHPYSQHTLPLGPYTNMIGYPFLPQSYTYMPSAFQQAFAGNNSYHQSLAAVLPQYKNSVSVSSLPQSAAVASGFGAFGSTSTLPGNFSVNTPAAPSGTTLGYEDVLSSQYKENNHLVNLQQSENSAMWHHGAGSRTMSNVPASTYYSLQGQTQQPGGFRQGQQPSQSYGTLGYPNFYHSQTGISLDHQQQNPRDGSLGGSQGQPKQTHQLWQNNY